MDYDEILLDCEERMEKAVDVCVKDMKGIRGGRATPALVEGVRVEYYGSLSPLKQIASISTPDPRLIVIKPFDGSVIKEIEKAIQKADVGLTPNSDGKMIRIAIPPLSEERRRQLAGVAKEKAEEAKVAIRNVRRDSNKNADVALKDKVLTEDDHHKVKDEIQNLTKTYEGKTEEALAKKEKEIMEV
ncbi:MAG: ribosome recycling factor [Planctomycetes bacterium]|nr:ribosome recycling factor [Planctomycetota bacterium]